MKQFHVLRITGLNAHIQTDAENLFEMDEGLLCYVKEIIRFLNR